MIQNKVPNDDDVLKELDLEIESSSTTKTIRNVVAQLVSLILRF